MGTHFKKTVRHAALMTVAGFLGVSLCLAFAPSAFAQKKIQSSKSLVKYRQIFMDVKAKHNQGIKLLTRGSKSGVAIPAVDRIEQIISHSKALAEMAPQMLSLFPKDSFGSESRATEGIWDEAGEISAEFQYKAGNMRGHAEELVKVAEKGNMNEIRRQAAQLALACRECHSDFREEE